MRVRLARLITLAAIGSVISGVVPTAVSSAATPTTSQPPADYIEMSGQLSQPIYRNTNRQVFEVPAFDGKALYVQVVRPEPKLYGNGPWPVILEASPYHGTLADRDGTRMFPDPVNSKGKKLGLTGYFAPRGYAVAMFDLRGTGRSEGCLDHLGQNDAKDLSTVIEWLATRSWSNGRVGMTGHSYVGSTPSVAAALPPGDREGLVTIVPSAGLASMYDHQFNRGVPWLLQWVGPMYAYEQLALYRDLPPGVPPPPVLGGGPSGDNWENAPNPEIGCGLKNSSLTAGTGQVTGQYEGWHAQRDWRAGATSTNIPIFMIHGVNDNAARIPAAEWFFGERFMRPGDKVWLGQWDHGSTNGRCGDFFGNRTLHPTCRFDQMKYAIHAWFDKHLKGMNVDTGPAVEVFLNGERPVDVTQVMFPEAIDGPVYTDSAWRRPQIISTLYPDATNMSLGAQRPAQNGSASFTTLAEAVLANVGRGRATFRSAPFAQDTLYVGLPQLQLNASVTNPFTHLTATLYRERVTGVNEDGAEIVEREPMNFCAIQPMLREDVRTLSPVVPAQEMTLPMQCFTMAHWVPAGQRLALEISTGSQHHAAFGAPGRVTVYTGAEKTKYSLPTVSGATLWDDVPLLENYPDVPGIPVGPAQQGFQETVHVPAPGAGVIVDGVTAESVEFVVDRGYDNASLEVVAVPDPQPADIDLYLERQDKITGEWHDTGEAGESSSTEQEQLEAGRLSPGRYRVVVHNWAGAPVDVEVTGTFFNQDGEPGPAGGGAQAFQAVEVNSASFAFLPLP